MSVPSVRRSSSADVLSDENWFHGRLSREQSEVVLRTAGFREGLFLVRESSVPRDFVLSVVHNNVVLHYQIMKRKTEDDALFSLGEDKKIIQGLDAFIEYYRHGKKTGLQHALGDHVPGSLAPPESRLHGTENLLHRACKMGELTVVSELLSMGYRNIDAKNHDSQTAIHIASYYGHWELLECLVKHRAKVNITDTEGYSPLGFAAINNHPQCVRLLLERAGANPTMRNEQTGWVPLHEAANKGHIDCVATLLEFHAPSKPRTSKNETPADLARAGGHPEVAALIDKYPPVFPETASTQWYHPNIDRKTAVALMKESCNKNGTFLIRNSSKKLKFYVLSMLFTRGNDLKGHHFEIEKQGIYFFIDEGPYMMSLEQLVQHYSRFSDGLPCSLRYPVKPVEVQLSTDTLPRDFLSISHSRTSSTISSALLPSPMVPDKSPQMLQEMAMLSVQNNIHPNLPPRVPQRGPSSSTVLPSNLKPMDPRQCYENNDTLRRVRHSKDNVPLESIKLTQVIGEGEFGSVFKGSYMTDAGVVKDVAIKALSDETIEPGQSEDFLREAKVMMDLDHQCVVQLLGISHGPPVLMILELVPLGSLLSYLEDNPKDVSAEFEIPLWASQIACGMTYLQSKKFVHRDLAARNILLSSKYQTKISDFGLSRVIGEKDYYRASKGGRWPVKWYAPECINYGTFTHASDVWSYGIVLWEMFSYGKQPYEGKTGVKTLEYLEAGNRLAMPEKATNDDYGIMLQCWQHKPEERPSFEDLFKYFSDNPEYLNLTELLKTQDFQQLGM